MRPLRWIVVAVALTACSDSGVVGPEDAFLSADIDGAIVTRYRGDASFAAQGLQVTSSDRGSGSDEWTMISLKSLDGITLDDGGLVSFYDLDSNLTPVAGVVVELLRGGELYAARNARLALGEVTADVMTGRFAFRAYQVCPSRTGERCSIPSVVPTDRPYVDVTGRFVAKRQAPPRPLPGG